MGAGISLGNLLRAIQRLLGFEKTIARDLWGGTMGSVAAFGMLFIGEWDVISVLVTMVAVSCVGTVSLPDAVWYMNRIVIPREGEDRRGDDGRKRTFDHRRFVVDEVIGMLIGVLPVYIFDVEWFGTKFWPLLAALVAFRIFDGTKVLGVKLVEDWFERKAEKVAEKAGDEEVYGRYAWISSAGVMLDDVAAGILVFVTMCLAHFYVECIWPVL